MEIEKVKEGLHICTTEGSDCTRCSYHEYGYPYSCHFRLTKDAFTAMEELMAQVKDKDYLIQQQADEIERLRRDVKKQQEKMFELAKKLPKRGEWKATEMYMTDECTACGFLMNWEDVPACLFNLPHFTDRCPNCGAKMEDVK